MANIPVERTPSPFPWWLLAVGLAVVAVGAYIVGDVLFDDDDDDLYDDDHETVAVAPIAPAVPDEPVHTEPAESAKLTSVARIVAAPLTVVGSEIAIPNMHVTDVVGDKTFYVTANNHSSDQQFFVFLDEQATPDDPGVEGRYDVNAGQTLTVYGSVQKLDESDRDKWNITETEAQRLGDDAVYLRAERLDITEHELDLVEVD